MGKSWDRKKCGFRQQKCVHNHHKFVDADTAHYSPMTPRSKWPMFRTGKWCGFLPGHLAPVSDASQWLILFDSPSIKLFRLSICLFWLDWSKCVAWKLVKSPVFCQIDPRTVQVDILKALMPVWGRDGPLLVIPACFLVKMAQITTCLCTFNGQNLPCTQRFWVTTWGSLRAKEPCAQRSSASLAG